MNHELILIAALFLWNIWTEMKNKDERAVLLDRIMAKGLPEYVNADIVRNQARVDIPKPRAVGIEL